MKKYIKSSNDDIVLKDTKMLMAEALDVLNSIHSFDADNETWKKALLQIRQGCETIITKEANGTISTKRN